MFTPQLQKLCDESIRPATKPSSSFTNASTDADTVTDTFRYFGYGYRCRCGPPFASRQPAAT